MKCLEDSRATLCCVVLMPVGRMCALADCGDTESAPGAFPRFTVRPAGQPPTLAVSARVDWCLLRIPVC
jgi:hypothetical protein